ncbi:MAG: glycoside hydrolase family 9 protein [Verrucomicrobiota bacterium]|nr:glycoside hydrolase family 9 protein [Verrucomicrobiota bacterium]
MNKQFWIVAVLAVGIPLGGAEGNFNYAEALQKTLYFFEAQQSGRLSPNNRVEWRGPSCLTDGQDIGRDLAGGWYDAGDHWTANLTMSFAATTLAWSAIEHPQGYVKSGQMDELLESLIYVNQYFLKCVLNPDCKDPANDLQVAIGCGGLSGIDGPSVHSMWAPAEVAHLMTMRPTFRVDKAHPGGDIPAGMAASMAASSMVIRDHAAALKGKRGYEDFDAGKFAERLLEQAEKLVVFAQANCGEVITNNMPEARQQEIRKKRSQAVRADGKVVELGYRADPFDKIFVAATFLQRAHAARDPKFGTKWVDFANEIYEGPYKAEWNQDWWKDFSAGNFGKLGAYNMMRLAPAEEKFHAELQFYCVQFCNYKKTPGGLRLREWDAHEYGSLRHANNAAVIAMYYSQQVEQAPELKGNLWWKKGQSNAELREMFFREARRQVDYALGANPYGRSFLVGFGNEPFNHVHHRGAYGAWAGFEHFIKGKADDRATARHILYGALVAGPDHNDVFLCGKEQRPWLPSPDGKGSETYYKFPNRTEPVRKATYQFDRADQPFQDVMDSQFNEVALDYNAGFTASLALLTAKGLSSGSVLPDAQFPPKAMRDEGDDLLKTDREFFVSAKRIAESATGAEIEATVWNRSRWPAVVSTNLSFRYYFTLDGSVRVEDVRAKVNGAKAAVKVAPAGGGREAFVEVGFPGEAIYPGNLETVKRTLTLTISAPEWNGGNDWSQAGMREETRLQRRIPVYEGGRRVGGEEPGR